MWQEINTFEQLQRTIGTIDVRGSFAWDWQFHIEPLLSGLSGRECGWKVWATFARPDIETGRQGEGRTRREFVEIGATKDAVAKTVFVLLKLTVEHELMESFCVGGARVFNPHHTVDELAAIRKESPNV